MTHQFNKGYIAQCADNGDMSDLLPVGMQSDLHYNANRFEKVEEFPVGSFVRCVDAEASGGHLTDGAIYEVVGGNKWDIEVRLPTGQTTMRMRSRFVPHTFAPVEETILEEAAALVGGERQRDYGHPLDNFTRIARYWNAQIAEKLVPGCEITPEDVGSMMVGLKLAREINTPKRDNLVDGAGYLYAMSLFEGERERRAANREDRAYLRDAEVYVSARGTTAI